MDPVDDVESTESVRNLRIADLVDVEAMLRDVEAENDAHAPARDTVPPESGVTTVHATLFDAKAAATKA